MTESRGKRSFFSFFIQNPRSFSLLETSMAASMPMLKAKVRALKFSKPFLLDWKFKNL